MISKIRLLLLFGFTHNKEASVSRKNMIFKFFSYLQPTWYFNLAPLKEYRYFPFEGQLAETDNALIRDENYLSEEAKDRDLAFRAFQCGHISRKRTAEKGLNVWQAPVLPVQDEYRFLRKNFHYLWVWYVLFLRLLSLKNPYRELRGFSRSTKVKRVKYGPAGADLQAYEQFQSTLTTEQPLVSVIIPTLNRYEYLKDVFKDLEKQDYPHFEVIVVDQTDLFDESVYQGWDFELHYWYQKEKALWKARNEAIQRSRGELILLYDDDSLIEANWISEHLKALDFFNADISSGVSISKVGAAVPEHYSYFRWSDQLDTGNVLIKKNVFETVGLFDRQFEKERMGDGEFGLRAYLAGFRNISNPKAKRIHLKVGQGGLRQVGSWDAFRPKSFWAPRPVPSVLYFYRKYFGRKAAILSILKNVPPGIVPYSFKGNKLFLFIGTIFSLLLWPLFLWQIYRSWNIASEKLKQPEIDEFS